MNKKAPKKYSIKDILLHLEQVHKLKIDNAWVTSGIPKKTANLLENLRCILPTISGVKVQTWRMCFLHTRSIGLRRYRTRSVAVQKRMAHR